MYFQGGHHWCSVLHNNTCTDTKTKQGARTSLGVSPDCISAKFEIARGILVTAGRHTLQPDSRRRDFICVVKLHHYTALLYAIRCLQLHDQRRRELVVALFAQTAIMTAVDKWLHMALLYRRGHGLRRLEQANPYLGSV